MSSYLIHYGTLGQKWGKRNYQYEDGSLTPEGRDHYGIGPPRNVVSKIASKYRAKSLRKKDDKWLKKQGRTTAVKLQKEAQRSKELKEYDRKLRSTMPVYNKNRTLNKNYVAKYNMALATLMNQKAEKLDNYSPSGMVLRFIAKRGEIGVHNAIATPNYDMNKVRRGVTADGKVAYKKQYIERTESDRR